MKRKMGWIVILMAAAAAAAIGQGNPPPVWVTTIHVANAVTIGKTYRSHDRALADARASGGDPNLWVVITSSELVNEGGAR